MQERQLVGLVVVIAVIALALGVTIGYSLSSGRTSTTQSGKTITMTGIDVTLLSTPPNSTSITSVGQAGWTNTFQSGLNPPINETFHIPTNGILSVDVQYFYYNSSAATTFNFSKGQQIGISGDSLALHRSFNAESNFTVLSNVSSVAFGGKNNQSEGTAIQYSIIPKQDLNGTYEFNFGWLYPSQVACGTDFGLVIGNGLPDYGYMGGCTAPLSNYYPVNSKGFVDGFLFAKIVEVSSSLPIISSS